jgi:HD superfamily phosphohydrolase/uncharacterized protein YjbK
MEENQDSLCRSISSLDQGVKHIRDNVHGDIPVPDKFLQIINTSAFQRLRRIRQLATAQYAFPSADHTRFIHSLGTFHVMGEIIAHFDQYFQFLGRKPIKPQMKDALLAASLLHDLGHTPFSHAMEDVLPNAKKIPHEKWTTDIIKGDEELRDTIIKNFGEDGLNNIVELISRQHDDDRDSSFSAQEINMNNIFASLISSQLDADRLDYIRRDALATGLGFGMIDIDRLISGFRVGIRDDGTAVICIAEKFIPDIEGYLYARYQMYRNVYFKPFKMFSEELLRKIIRNVYNLYECDKLQIGELPLGFKAALQKPAMSIADYLSLDDYVIMGAVKGWANLTGDRAVILTELCRCLINRTGFKKYTFKDVSNKAIVSFKRDILLLLTSQNIAEVDKIRNESEDEIEARMNELDPPFLIVKIEYPKMYAPKENNEIYIIENSGRLVKLSHCSGLIKSLSEPSCPKGDAVPAVSAIYYNVDILKLYLKYCDRFGKLQDDHIRGVVASMEKLLDSRSTENSIEIEKKFFVPPSLEGTIQNDLIELILAQGYSVISPENIHQEDRYLDTATDKLHENRCALRIRIKEGDGVNITCKRPVMDSISCGEAGQMERYEYIWELENAGDENPSDIYKSDVYVRFIETYLKDLVKTSDLMETIVIENDREKHIIESRPESSGLPRVEERYELVFDVVTYTNLKNGKQHKEFQIEIELKSDRVARLNMQSLTDEIQRRLPDLVVMTDSKYERDTKFTN